jgi:acyl-CoA thioester hydrolase
MQGILEGGVSVSIDITVRFAETDAMRVVHHSNYIIWFEAARVAWFDAAGVPYGRLTQEGRNLAVTGVQAEYRHSVRFGDSVRVTATLTRARSRQVDFAYVIRNIADDALVVTGRTEHVCVDDEGRVASIPGWLMDRLAQAVSANGDRDAVAAFGA